MAPGRCPKGFRTHLGTRRQPLFAASHHASGNPQLYQAIFAKAKILLAFLKNARPLEALVLGGNCNQALGTQHRLVVDQADAQ